MKVKDLEDPTDFKTSVVITHPSEPDDEILFFISHKKGKREQNEDGTWPDAIKSKDNHEPDKQQLLSGIDISRYKLKDGKYTIDEVKEKPKRRTIGDETMGITDDDKTVKWRKTEVDFMFWDEFQDEYGDYEIIGGM